MKSEWHCKTLPYPEFLVTAEYLCHTSSNLTQSIKILLMLFICFIEKISKKLFPFVYFLSFVHIGCAASHAVIEALLTAAAIWSLWCVKILSCASVSDVVAYLNNYRIRRNKHDKQHAKQNVMHTCIRSFCSDFKISDYEQEKNLVCSLEQILLSWNKARSGE